MQKKLDQLLKASKTIAEGANEFLRTEYLYLGVFAVGMAIVIVVSGLEGG